MIASSITRTIHRIEAHTVAHLLFAATQIVSQSRFQSFGARILVSHRPIVLHAVSDRHATLRRHDAVAAFAGSLNGCRPELLDAT